MVGVVAFGGSPCSFVDICYVNIHTICYPRNGYGYYTT